MKTFLSKWLALVPGILAACHGIDAGAAMAVDSLSGPITANEITSFKNYMAGRTIAVNNAGNAWLFGSTGNESQALGIMYEATGDIGILDRMIQYADTALAGRNDTNTGYLMWTGKRELCWPHDPFTEPIYTSCESGEVVHHILHCARLILQTPSIWNTTVAVGDPRGYGTTYKARALKYLVECDKTIDTFVIPIWVSVAHGNQIYSPTDWNGDGGANGGPVAWNRISMFIAGLQNSAECHEILGDNPAKVAQLDTIVQANVQWFLTKTVPYTKSGFACYNWFYRADTTSKDEEVWENHGALDIRMLWEGYDRGIGLPRTEMIKFGNTMQYSVWTGSVFHGLFDGTDDTFGTKPYTKGEYMRLADYLPDLYTIIGNANQSHTTDPSMISTILWMKNRRYQQFALKTLPPGTRTIPGGATTNFVVSVSPMGGTTNTVTLTVSGLPAGAAGSFSAPAINLASVAAPTTNSILSITTLSSTPPGVYPLSIVGTSTGISHTGTVTLIIGTFGISLTPASQVVGTTGTNVNYTISATTNNGFSGSISFGVSGLPANTAFSFTPASLGGAGASVFNVTTSNTTPAGNYTLTFSGTNGSVVNTTTAALVIGRNVANLSWSSTVAGAWDLTNSFNWFNAAFGSADQFYNGDSVLLDDTPGIVTNLTLAVTVLPAVITNLSGANSFTIGGAGKISGAARIVKSGESTLTLNNANDFTGTVTIDFGTLKAGSTSALGATNGATIITNSGALDVNGLNLGTEPIVVSGVGVEGTGAIINQGAAQTTALKLVTLAGDTTFGGTGRWDIRGNPAYLRTSPPGSAYTIFKVGTNQVSLVAVTNIDAAFGDIEVQEGIFGIQTTTAQVGDPAKTITIYSGATLNLFRLTNNPLNKKLVFEDGATFFSENDSNLVYGAVTLDGNVAFNVNSNGGPGGNTGALVFTNVLSGAGGVTKLGSGLLKLTAASTYSGDTTINSNVLALAGNGSIAGSANISIAPGSVLDVSGRADKMLSLAVGQTLQGRGTLKGSLTVSNNAAVSPGTGATLGVLMVTNAVTLKGSAFMKLSKAGLTNDVLQSAAITYGGTLVLTNLAGTLTNGDSFRLFTAATYGGAFTNILPVLSSSGLAWDASALITNGTLRVVAYVPPPSPVITSLTLAGTNLVIGGTNGVANGSYYLVGTTNLALPFSNWTQVATGSFGAGRQMSLTNPMPNNAPQWFFRLQVPLP